ALDLVSLRSPYHAVRHEPVGMAVEQVASPVIEPGFVFAVAFFDFFILEVLEDNPSSEALILAPATLVMVEVVPAQHAVVVVSRDCVGLIRPAEHDVPALRRT